MRLASILGSSAVTLALVSPVCAAQTLSARVSAVSAGSVTFHFAARPGTCGDGARFIRLGNSSYGDYSNGWRSDRCTEGPVQVQLTLRDGGVDRVDAWVGPLRSPGGLDLGAVPAADAARYLMSIAAHGGGGASTRAIMPAVLADSAVVWPALPAIARDTVTRSRSTRQDASFWLSRFAGVALAGHPNDLASDEDDAGERDDGVKSQAVFALSQLPHGEGVPPLLEVARSHPDKQVRRRALFWLGQSGDPRALALFETLLRK